MQFGGVERQLIAVAAPDSRMNPTPRGDSQALLQCLPATRSQILRMACCFEMRVPAACYYSTCTPDVFALPCTTCATGSTNGRRASTWSPAQARALTRATVGYSDSIRRRGRAEHADDADDVYCYNTLLSQLQERRAGQMGLVITDEGATAEGWGL